jgi:hypothetical protein
MPAFAAFRSTSVAGTGPGGRSQQRKNVAFLTFALLPAPFKLFRIETFRRLYFVRR